MTKQMRPALTKKELFSRYELVCQAVFAYVQGLMEQPLQDT